MINLKLKYKVLQRFIHWKMRVYFVISLLCLRLICAQKVSVDKTLVYGPGLKDTLCHASQIFLHTGCGRGW